MQKNVLDYLNYIVTQKPNQTAYSDGTVSMTFRQVYDQSRAIGSLLYERGIYQRPVVIFMKKSPQEIAAFFGVISGGCYYVPVDEEMPAGRIQLILDNVQTPLVICDESTAETVKRFSLRSGDVILYQDAIRTPVNDAALQDIYDRALDTDPIYIIFTSGSTGIPKGVITHHRAVIDYVEQLSEALEFDENTVFGNQTPLYVDACLKEIYPTVKFGAAAYLIPKENFSFPIRLVEYLNEYHINTICWVVSALTIVSSFGTFSEVRPQYLRTVAFGSEVFPVKQLKLWMQAVPGAAFYNLYGPTETTGMCCWYKVEGEIADDAVIPAGHAFHNREVMLITDDGRQADPGETGEICVRGSSLALGYYNDPERTAQVFVQNPFQSAYAERIYKTGDLGYRNEKGELVFVSRRDHQIKHMGNRIELGEIEFNAAMDPGADLAACIYDTEKGKIVLFYVGALSEKELTVILKERLPKYMLPNKTIKLETMPLTANGKTDRMALKQMYEETKIRKRKR